MIKKDWMEPQLVVMILESALNGGGSDGMFFS